MYLYQDASGNWIVFDGTVKQTFGANYGAALSYSKVLERSEVNMSKKVDFARRAQAACNQLAALLETAETLQEVYDARQYGPGMAGAVTDEDLAELDITADNLYAAMIAFDQIRSLVNNLDAAKGDYMATVNKLRTDL